MTFSPGDRVHVESLGRGIVREVRNGGRFLVELKGRSVVVAGGQLAREGPPRKRRQVTRPPETQTAVSSDEAARPLRIQSLDLHGMTVLEAVDALDECLNRAAIAGVERVHVIHGRSGGRIRAAVHERLEQIRSIRGYCIDPANEGVTIVTL